MYLNHCKYIWEKIKMNQESSDRYFNYFLLFITTPVVFLAALIPKLETDNSNKLSHMLPPICFVLFLIGFCFFLAYVKFRVHKIKYVLELRHIEKNFLEHKLYGSSLGILTSFDKTKTSLFSSIGGDFFLSAVQMVTNGFWLTLFVYTRGFVDNNFRLFLLIFLIIAVQWLIRHFILSKYESLTDSSHNLEASN